MIVFAALIPTSPLLVKHSGKLPDLTLKALSQISSALDATKPETVLLISEGARSFSSTFVLPYATVFVEALKRLGFIARHIPYTPDAELLAKLQSTAHRSGIPLRSVHSELLDAGSAMALRLLEIQKKQYSIVTIGTSASSIAEHENFGYSIKDVIHGHTKRVAILITGDAGDDVSAQGIIASLVNRTTALLTKISAAGTPPETISRALAISYGLLRGFPTQTKILCDEVLNGFAFITAILFTE